MESQGTRVHVYRWLNSAVARKEADTQHLKSLPEVKTKKKWTKKIRPGADLTLFILPQESQDS